MINIYKASAGSGKTHKLAQEYIRLLLTKDDNTTYRHILAVTFTNKATEEMKSRILGDLFILSKEPQKSRHYKDFKGIFPDDEALKAKSMRVLNNILHDYSAFSVSTIDTFFQKTLKAFSREIGQFSAYQVELDKESLISECVGRLLDSLTDAKSDEKKLSWLTDNAINTLEEGSKFYLEYSLIAIAKRLRSEEHRSKLEACGLDGKTMYSEENVKKLADGCSAVIKSFNERLAKSATTIEECFRSAGVHPDETNYKFINEAINYKNLRPLSLAKAPGKRLVTNEADHDNWFGAGSKSKLDRLPVEVFDAVSAIVNQFREESKLYATAHLLNRQVYGFGLANEIDKNFDALLAEKNVLGIDDSNSYLKNIIDGTDAPFIYEKMGVRYDHFLLDEFQDTSRIQWDNFKPLLANSSAAGDNLVVGDVKQSIYRWRGSDWEILKSEIADAYPRMVKEETLKTNWRSSKEIVDFNNEFFIETAALLDRKYGSEDKAISKIYSDVVQRMPEKERTPGGVKVDFVDKDEMEKAVLAAINEAIEAGFAYNEIGVLIRGKDDGAKVAKALIDEGIEVVTDDSLKIMSALTVRRLMSVLASIDNPADKLSSYLAEQLNITVPEQYHSLVDLCEDLLRQLKASDEESFNAETLFIQSFMDKVIEFGAKGKTGLHAFLEDMEGDTTSISSPAEGNSVRIMTIHKSKGLAFPFVIVPYAETIGLFRSDKSWCRPNVAGTQLEDVATGIYDVTLSGKSESTLFGEEYKAELLKQYVDNLNVAYVAFTRARYQMRILATMPKDLDESVVISDADIKNFGDILFNYRKNHDIVCNPSTGRQEDDVRSVSELPSTYHSWPLGGRLTFSKDSTDFFDEEGKVGVAASNRLRGIVLHDIMSKVISISDLDSAVKEAVDDGRLSAGEAEDAAKLLKNAIKVGVEHGWFPEDASKVWNEVTLIDEVGEVHRADRVVEMGDHKLAVIDYKFGEEKSSHKKQVREYAELYRKMGYEVAPYLWYVEPEKILPL